MYADDLDDHQTETSARKQQLAVALAVTLAISEAIREAGEIPSGTLYAIVMGKVDLNGYQKILDILTNASLIRVMPSHLIRWVGPNRISKEQVR